MAITRTPKRYSTERRRWTRKVHTTGWKSWAYRCVWTGRDRFGCAGAASARSGKWSIISPCSRVGSRGRGRRVSRQQLPARRSGCPASQTETTSLKSPRLSVLHPRPPPTAPTESSPITWRVWRRWVDTVNPRVVCCVWTALFRFVVDAVVVFKAEWPFAI